MSRAYPSPDLPGCLTAGVDLDDARRMAEEVLAVHLAGMTEGRSRCRSPPRWKP